MLEQDRTILYANNIPYYVYPSVTGQIDANFRDLESQIQAGFDAIDKQRRENTIASLQSQINAYRFGYMQQQVQDTCIENLFTQQTQSWNDVRNVVLPDAQAESDVDAENDMEPVKAEENTKNGIIGVVITFILGVALSVWIALLDPTPFISLWSIIVFVSRCVASSMLLLSVIERATESNDNSRHD